jgi:hypothetical protein
MLVDQPVLDLTNRWRRERGERELTLEDIGPENQHRLRVMAAAAAGRSSGSM